jgi:hypothetical protein
MFVRQLQVMQNDIKRGKIIPANGDLGSAGPYSSQGRTILAYDSGKGPSSNLGLQD